MKQQCLFGVIADAHLNLIPDGMERLKAFIDAMKTEKPDFIVSLGDFCPPYKGLCEPFQLNADAFFEIWNSFDGPKYHVYGNHDCDNFRHVNSFSDQEITEFFGMPGPYYSFDNSGFHFVVLNGNERQKDGRIYPSRVGAEQRRWLEEDLDGTDLPVVVFMHQGVDIDDVSGSLLVRRTLERANEKAGRQKVRLFLSAHYHLDYHNVINNIHYVQINSMSMGNILLGSELFANSYPEAYLKKVVGLRKCYAYKDPLWALVTMDNGEILIRGKKSEIVSPTLEELGFNAWERGFPYDSTAQISDRHIRIGGAG
jgi:predicted phosphodiesterase